jgi:hypothetical protein
VKIARIESQLKANITSINNNNQEQRQLLSMNSFDTTVKPVELTDDESPPSLSSPTSMIVSQSNHYNCPTRSKQQQQNITMNSFNTSTNMTYNYGNISYPYAYPPAPSIDMQPLYYPATTSMDYMPYYPASSSLGYPPIYDNPSEQQSLFYPSNVVNSISYNGNGIAAPYVYPSAQSSSTAPTTQRN